MKSQDNSSVFLFCKPMKDELFVIIGLYSTWHNSLLIVIAQAMHTALPA